MINKLDYLQLCPNERPRWHGPVASSPFMVSVRFLSVLADPCHSALSISNTQLAIRSDSWVLRVHHTQHNRVRSPALCTHQHVNHGNPHMGVDTLGPYQTQNICPPCWVCTLLVPVTHTDKSNRNIHTVSHWWFCNTAHSFNNTNPECHIT